jgi:hypothetical protein
VQQQLQRRTQQRETREQARMAVDQQPTRVVIERIVDRVLARRGLTEPARRTPRQPQARPPTRRQQPQRSSSRSHQPRRDSRDGRGRSRSPSRTRGQERQRRQSPGRDGGGWTQVRYRHRSPRYAADPPHGDRREWARSHSPTQQRDGRAKNGRGPLPRRGGGAARASVDDGVGRHVRFAR